MREHVSDIGAELIGVGSIGYLGTGIEANGIWFWYLRLGAVGWSVEQECMQRGRLSSTDRAKAELVEKFCRISS